MAETIEIISKHIANLLNHQFNAVVNKFINEKHNPITPKDVKA